MKILQVMNALSPRDAVSQHLLEMDAMLRTLGHETEIYSQFADPALEERRRPIEELSTARGDLLLFHYAGFSQILGIVARFAGRRGVVYHNVTPARFFEDVPETHEFCERGRKQVDRLADIFHFGIGDSTYNADELRAAGMEHVRVVPLPWEASGIDAVVADPAVVEAPEGEAASVLMVGRVSEHKGVHFGVRAMSAVEAAFGRPVNLSVVGRTDGYDRYVRSLRETIRTATRPGQVDLVGEVTPSALRAHYERADALLVLSDHEGFCVPVIEAHAFGVPIVAHAAGAVAETLGDGGILLEGREPEAVAAALVRVLPGGAERDAILARQKERLPGFSRSGVQAALADALAWARALPEPEPDDREPSFSVVVCTYNRDWVLRKCLEGLRHLDYPEYEVVVVNGPSTDKTSEVLDSFSEIKRVDNPERNLSISRNLGIAASAGEIIAFIDDDAMPGPDWLTVLAEAYADPAVGAAGGRVHGPGGDHLQFDNGIITRWGLPRAIQDAPDDQNAPDGEWFNTLMGTNSSFRRTALEEVGGFDENYEYYHDESDLCVRIIRAGYRVEHVPAAQVWHEFEKSRIRKTTHHVNWAVIVKNTIYFYFKLNRWKRRPWDTLQPIRACLVHLGIFTRWFVHGNISIGSFFLSLGRWTLGFAQGYFKGLSREPRRWLDRHRDQRSRHLTPYESSGPVFGRRRMHVVLISQQYPPDACGGVGQYTERLASGLVEAGHRVSVVAQANRDSVTWRDGVQVFRVRNAKAPAGISRKYTVVRKNLGRSLAVDQKIEEIDRQAPVDIVEGPIWDAEAYVPCLRRQRPVVLRVTTPMAMAIETQGWRRNEDMDLACEMEWEALRRPRGVVDTSGTVLDTIGERWGVRPDGSATCVIPFGVPLPDDASAERPGPVRFLFVGRLERRKGIDVLGAAMPRVIARCPDVRFQIAGEFLGGEGPDDILGSVPPEVREKVQFLGWVDDETRERLYAECSAFVAPSRYESFGIVYVEAMSHGKPVVACDVGGARRIVDHEVNGLLVPEEDVDALVEALVRLATHEEERRRMGRAAREKAVAEYGVPTMVRRSVEFYESILDGSA